MNKNVDWEIISRYLSGESDKVESEKVSEWINSDPANIKLLDRIEKIWNTNPVKSPGENYEYMWKNIASATGISQTKPQRAKIFQIGIRKIAAIAAVLVIGIVAPYFLIQNNISPVAQFINYKTIEVANGQNMTITLADGSIVTLDAGSELKYPRSFNQATREVYLHGEAFFKVAKNPEKPFIVHAGNSITRVLGTSFNLRSWNIDGGTDLAVAEGRVAFKSKNDPDSLAVILTKDMYSSLSDDGILQDPVSVDIEKYTSWMDGSIQLSNTSLSEIIDQIERWYDIDIQFADQSLLDQVFTIHITKESLDDVLLLLSALTETSYTLGKGVAQFS